MLQSLVILMLLLAGPHVAVADFPFPFQRGESDTVGSEQVRKIRALIEQMKKGRISQKELDEANILHELDSVLLAGFRAVLSPRTPEGRFYLLPHGADPTDPKNYPQLTLIAQNELPVAAWSTPVAVPAWWVWRTEARLDSLQKLVDRLNAKLAEPPPSLWKQLFGR